MLLEYIGLMLKYVEIKEVKSELTDENILTKFCTNKYLRNSICYMP